MNKIAFSIVSLLMITVFFQITACSTDKTLEKRNLKSYEWKTKESNGYSYRYVENDPSQSRFYTLENGLTVILSPSEKSPRIQTFIAVKAGSKTDPATHTGLAHYLEHLLFKGTDKYGSLDWGKEKPLLDEIGALYEEYNSETDEAIRADIYKKIDQLSGEAAKYAIANEYDKMMAGMGGEGTNAWTSVEETVYIEDIPNNVINKFLTLQAERFRNPVFRLFHTELEAVYEEKNISLDRDDDKVYEAVFAELFPNHNYGKQTTIGTIDHLKNPSLVEIRKYFETYYVPNNMGIVMAGDFNPDEVIKSIDEAFGYMESKPVPEYNFKEEAPISKPIIKEVYGPEEESIMLGYRFPGAASNDAQMLALIGEVLTNGSTGLIDLNLVTKQKLLDAYAFPYVMKDYGTLLLSGQPTDEQSLEEVKVLLLGEINNLKSGKFSDEIITSIINNARKEILQVNEDYASRAYELVDNFVLGTDWKEKLTFVDWLADIKKQDIVDFANKYFGENYVAIYKKQGEADVISKVEKPTITPVNVNREAQSDFLKMINELPESEISPKWLNFDKDIQRSEAGKYKVLSVENKHNELFDLDFYVPTGKWDNKWLSLAVGYLEFIGTKDKTAEQFSKDFYRLATDYKIRTNDEETIISMNGLQDNFEESVLLIDDLLRNCVADDEALTAYLGRVKKSRENRKENKHIISFGLQNYAMYGANNPFNNTYTDEELASLKAADLVSIIHDLANYNHQTLYYGQLNGKEIAKVLEKVHVAPTTFAKLPVKQSYIKESQNSNVVLTAYYDMVQSEVFWLRNSDEFSPEKTATIALFNQYFGGGMDAIVFQTIRESMALAYSSYAYYREPKFKDDRYSFVAYVGTQNDKFKDATAAMNELLTNLPNSEVAVNNAKVSLLKKLATERTIGLDIIYFYIDSKNKGYDKDPRKIVYEELDKLDYQALNSFYKNEIGGKHYTYTIVAGKGKLKQTDLTTLGTIKHLELEDIFGY